MQRCWAALPAGRPTFLRLKTQLQDALSDAQAAPAPVSECVVCIDALATMALLPCGHRCVCAACAESLRGGRLPHVPGARARVRENLRQLESDCCLT